MKSRFPSGITIVEVLVAIGILAILAGLLLPAVQYARESSRRSHCLHNVRQLGIALHLYHDSFGGLPPSVIWSPPGEPLGNGQLPIGVLDAITMGEPYTEDRVFANWVIMLLPYLEERGLADAFDLTLPSGHPKNESARSTELPVMKCPSDMFNGPENHFQRSFSSTDAGYARGNYGLNLGTNQNCLTGFPGCVDGFSFEGSDLASNNRRVWGSGIGGANNSTRFRQFPNGLSKTVAVEEIRSGIDTLDRRGVWALGFVGSSVTASHGRRGHEGPNKGLDFLQGCPSLQSKLGALLDLENMGCSYRRPIDISEKATARSQHSSGVNLLMADGSAHFVADSVDAEVWHLMHRRDGAEPFEMPF